MSKEDEKRKRRRRDRLKALNPPKRARDKCRTCNDANVRRISDEVIALLREDGDLAGYTVKRLLAGINAVLVDEGHGPEDGGWLPSYTAFHRHLETCRPGWRG